MASRILHFVVTLVSVSFAHGDTGMDGAYHESGFDDSGMFVGSVGGVQGGLLGGSIGGVIDGGYSVTDGGYGSIDSGYGGMDGGYSSIDSGFGGIGGGMVDVGGVVGGGMYGHSMGMDSGMSGRLLSGIGGTDPGFGRGGMASNWARKMKMGGSRGRHSFRDQGNILGGGFGGRRSVSMQSFGNTGRRTIGTGGIRAMSRRHFSTILGGGFGGRRSGGMRSFGNTGRRTLGTGGIRGMSRRHFKTY